ncbi:MAG: ribonuclease E activity regulator RraA [Methyloligella sp. ZOD6]
MSDNALPSTYPSTCDLYDQFLDAVRVPWPIFRDFGGRRRFSGSIATVKCFEDNSRIKEQVALPGEGRVLVIDAGGSNRCAVMGDLVAGEAAKNGWAGILLFGFVRDVCAVAELDIGLKALGSIPRKSVRRGEGTTDIPLNFAGVDFNPGDIVIADEDGVIVMTPEQAKSLN